MVYVGYHTMIHVVSSLLMSVCLFYFSFKHQSTFTFQSVQLGQRRSEPQQTILTRNPVLKIKRFILNMSLSKQVSEFLKLSKESRTYPGSKELGRTVRTQIAMPHPKHALQTLWPFTKIRQSSNPRRWAVILPMQKRSLKILDFDRIQTYSAQILVGRCY